MDLLNIRNLKVNDIVEARTGRVLYLGSGRNAYHNTWVKHYFPNCISKNVGNLKNAAEGKRVQGSTFKIEAIPALFWKFQDGTYAIIAEINEKYERAPYDLMEKRLLANGIKALAKTDSGLNRDWLIPLSATEADFIGKDPKNTRLDSYSNGRNYRLSWMPSKVGRLSPRLRNMWQRIQCNLETKETPSA